MAVSSSVRISVNVDDNIHSTAQNTDVWRDLSIQPLLHSGDRGKQQIFPLFFLLMPAVSLDFKRFLQVGMKENLVWFINLLLEFFLC